MEKGTRPPPNSPPYFSHHSHGFPAVFFPFPEENKPPSAQSPSHRSPSRSFAPSVNPKRSEKLSTSVATPPPWVTSPWPSRMPSVANPLGSKTTPTSFSFPSLGFGLPAANQFYSLSPFLFAASLPQLRNVSCPVRPLTTDQITMLEEGQVGDSEPARQLLGFHTPDLSHGLAAYLAPRAGGAADRRP